MGGIASIVGRMGTATAGRFGAVAQTWMNAARGTDGAVTAGPFAMWSR